MASLTPVVEFEPWSYSRQERPSPTNSRAVNPEGWFQFWSESLKDAGITGLTPWFRGSFLVSIDQLHNPTILHALVTYALSETVPLNLDEVCPLSGGYVFSHEDAALLPGCCGDLGNLREWEDAAYNSSETWRMLWIGHPWTFVRSSGGLLRFVEPSEKQNPDGLAEIIAVSPDELSRAINNASMERERFAKQLTPVVEALDPRFAAAEIVDIFVRGHPQLEG